MTTHLKYYAVNDSNMFTQSDSWEELRKDMENMKGRGWTVYERKWVSDGIALKEVRDGH